MASNEKPNDYLSAQKALRILMVFIPHNQEMGTTEISRRLNLNKSTISRLLRVLVYYGFLQHDQRTRKFRLGGTAAKMGLAIQHSLDAQIAGISQPYIDELRNTIGESVALETWHGNTTVLAYRAEALRHRKAFLLQQGDRIDAHVSGGVKVILAYASPEVVEDALKGPFHQFTSNTITDPEAIKAQLPKIRNDGYFISKGLRHLDSDIITVPVFNYTDTPVAAISLFTTPDRLPGLIEKDVIGQLKETARQVSSKLLYSGEHESAL